MTWSGCFARMRFHAEMLLVAILDLAHLGGALAILVLGRTRRGNQRGADYRTFLGQAWSLDYPDGAGIAPHRIRTSQYESEACFSCFRGRADLSGVAVLRDEAGGAVEGSVHGAAHGAGYAWVMMVASAPSVPALGAAVGKRGMSAAIDVSMTRVGHRSRRC